MRPATLTGSFAYEYGMQIRRASLWIAMAIIGVLLVSSDVWREYQSQAGGHSAVSLTVARWVFELTTFVPPLLAVLLADRLVRDRTLQTEELMQATSASPGARLWGKYLGVAAAAITPVALIWAIGVAEIALHFRSWSALSLGIGAFVALVVPSVTFATAVALALPSVIGVTFFRIAFVIYWVAGNLLIVDGLPNLSRTWLTPIGKFARDGFFGRAYEGTPWDTGATAGAAAGSVAVIVGFSLAIVLVLQIARRVGGRRLA